MKKYIATLKRFNDFQGNSSREELLHFASVHCVILGAFLFTDFAVGHPFVSKVTDTVNGLYIVGTMLPCVALVVRRFKSIKKQS